MTPVIGFSDNAAQLVQVVRDMGYSGGGTNFSIALQHSAQLFQQFARPNADKILFFQTDGGCGGWENVANQVKAQGIKIFAAGVGNSDFSQLRRYMASGDKYFISVSDYSIEQLNRVLESFMNAVKAAK